MKKIAEHLVFIIFWSLLLSFFVLFWILPDSAFSQTENRALADFPALRAEKLFDGRYVAELDTYVCDQFPVRDLWIRIKALSEMTLGKGENNGILQGEGGQLARRLYSMRHTDGSTVTDSDLYSMEHITSAAESLATAVKHAKVPTRILLPPRPIEVSADAFSYPTERGEALDAALSRLLTPTGAYIDLTQAFRQRQADGEAVYYRTDHHWTTQGAYDAYVAIMQSFDMEDALLPADAFDRQTVAEDFCGTLWSASGMQWIPGEPIEIWYRGNESDFSVIADGIPLSEGLYSLKYLTEKDKYSVFLDGTHDIVTVTKKGDDTRPRLLILKDSFANSAVPFLAQHFDLVLCNLSSARKDFTDLHAEIQKYDADYALILYSVGNMASTDVMNRIH